ncbi:MAG TPA: HYR domain-containing protein [Saprospiraceae bacterium]|nr:HYR domain-containing protein [Saprospiraceae bacterium]
MNIHLQKLIFSTALIFFSGVNFAQNAFHQRNGITRGNPNSCMIEKVIPLCPNQTLIVDSIPYAAPWIVTDTLPSATGGCDTIVTYKLIVVPFNKAGKTVGICPGETVVIDGMAFAEPGIYISNNPVASTNGGCDTLFTYHFVYIFQPSRSDTILLTPDETVTIGGNVYSAPDEVTEFLPASTGCDTLLIHVLLLDLTFPDTCSKTLTFLKVIGQPGVSERSSVICAAADGNFYIGGESEKKSLLLKVTPEGKVIWSRTFQPVASLTTRITDLIEDSDGMLAGCGIVDADTTSPEAYAFRYNPVTGSMIWSRYLKQAKPEAFAIVERFPGGPFFLLVSPQLVSNVDDAEIWELNRNNGTLVSAIGHYTFGNSDVWNSAVVHGGALYAAGRHIPGPVSVPAPLNQIQTGLTKIDMTTGTPAWSRLGTTGVMNATTLYSTDLLIHDDALIVVSAGSDSLNNSQRSAFFLQKTALNGDIIWLKRYSVPGLQNAEAHDIQRVYDGYILTGQANQGADDWDKIIVKTDFDGNVLWAKSVTSGVYFPKKGQFFIHNHQSVVRNNAIYLTAFTEDFSSDVLLLKMTTDGDVSDSCGFVQPLDVQTKTLAGSNNLPIQIDVAPYVVASFNAPATPVLVAATSAALCLRCCEPIQETELVEFCPGEPVTIDGIEYNQSGTLVDTIPGIIGCDTIITYTLVLLPQPMRSSTIEFCAGDTVTIGGNAYTQPGTVIDTITAAIGCDTVVTYTLQFTEASGGTLSINCPDDVNIAINAGTGPVVVHYDLPAVSSDCVCPGIGLTLTQGLASGSMFPAGLTTVCYSAKDSCGNSTACCFDVFVREESPCDIKTVGCLKWELLDITKDAENDLTYRIRVTNSCAGKMIYTAFGMPGGLVAVSPANHSVFTAQSGRQYEVRNPNYSPFYSIRFKSQADSIANGESDVFEYKLPAQTPPSYIHVTARLAPQVFYEAYLNTFYCPVGVTPDNNRSAISRKQDLTTFKKLSNLQVFPNPTSGALYADFSDWQGEQLQVQVFSSQGQRIQLFTVQAGDTPQQIALPEGLSAGLYFLEVQRANGERQTVRFVMQR